MLAQRKLPALKPAPLGSPEKLLPSVIDKKPAKDKRPTVGRKRAGVNSNGACEPCRKGKRRCDGDKPMCGACIKREISPSRCHYDQLEGLSRSQTLKFNANTMRDERDILTYFVKELLNVPPGTTVEELLRLTESQGILLPKTLGDEIKQLAHDRQTTSGKAMVAPSENGILTPEPSRERSLMASSHGHDPRNGSESPMSTSTETSIIPESSPHDIHVQDLASSHGDDYLDQLGLPDKDTSLSTLSVQRHDALVALCKQITLESQREDTRIQCAESRKTALQLASHVQIYAHMSMSSCIRTNGYPTAVQDMQILNFQLPLYMVLPMSLADQSPLSRTISGFLAWARTRVADGWSLADILGPDDFDVSRLVAEEQVYTCNFAEFSVPCWATSVMMTFTEPSLVCRLAATLHLSMLMKWLISPTPESYAALSESQRPTPTQRMIPHKAEYDMLHVPALRDTLIVCPREYMQPMLDWQACAWPLESPYVEVDNMTNSLIMTPAFKEFVTDADNYLYGPPFFETFPELMDKCNVLETT